MGKQGYHKHAGLASATKTQPFTGPAQIGPYWALEIGPYLSSEPTQYDQQTVISESLVLPFSHVASPRCC
jgi:hypothetical protein